VLKKQMAKEAEIAALVAMKQYFEDQKIVRVPIQ
jgi:propionyl-CoA carboxylase alpha chain